LIASLENWKQHHTIARFPLGPIDSYELLFPFSLREAKSNFLTVMFIVLLIYILYKGFQIWKWFITHCNSFPQFS
jgi:hypothetical protein